MKQIMKYTAVILATIFVLGVMWQFKFVLFLFLLSLFVAAAIRPLGNKLVAIGLPKAAAQILIYIISIAFFLVILTLIGELLFSELNVAANRLVVEYEALHERLQSGLGWQKTLGDMLPPPFTWTVAQETELGEMVPVVMNIAQGLFGALGGALLLFVFTVYWVVDQNRFERIWLSLLPVQNRVYARDSWREVENAVGDYLRNQAAQSLIAFFFLLLGAIVIGFNYPLLLAIFGALAAFVPIFGAFLTALFALMLGSLESTAIGIETAFFSFVIFLILELVVEPRITPRKNRSFLLIILVILPLFEAFGFWGLVLGPPIAAGLEAVVGQAYQAYLAQKKHTVQIENLETRLQKLTETVDQNTNENTPPELQNLRKRLANLLSESQGVQ